MIDGNDAIREDLPAIVKIIARTARWVHPEAFALLPVWAPYTARGRPIYDVTWTRQITNTSGSTGRTVPNVEANQEAAAALKKALGVGGKPKNWTVCHLWGYDDPSFREQASIVQDPRYYSCVGNMVWLPTPLKGFTDAVPEIKTMLRTCAFHLYGLECKLPSAEMEALKIQSGIIPPGYPDDWPTAERPARLPPGTASFTPAIAKQIAKQKKKIQRLLRLTSPNFPREEVREVLASWEITLD